MKIFFASGNSSKLDYCKRWCAEIPDLEIMTPKDIDPSLYPVFEEDGETFEANAILKAVNWSKAVNDMMVIAHDCGIEIPGLGEDWKAEWTKRQTGKEGTSDEDRIRAFIVIAKDLKDRIAFTKDAIALARNGELLGSTPATSLPGEILTELPEKLTIIAGAPLATVWYLEKFGKVYSELTTEEKELYEEPVVREFRKCIRETLPSSFSPTIMSSHI